MNKFATKIWRSVVPGRIVLLTLVLLFVSFWLLIFVLSAGDSDLPPYQPQTASELFCRSILAVVCWPAMAAGWTGGRAAELVALPLAFMGMVLWAGLVEFFIAFRNARRT